mmetsp:Transcript_16942/g.24115  ORF Transcript_16942/g.24115 Transcript_16942/m.24115 type:complete len:241 (-) Transcript_16942:186-908(-)
MSISYNFVDSISSCETSCRERFLPSTMIQNASDNVKTGGSEWFFVLLGFLCIVEFVFLYQKYIRLQQQSPSFMLTKPKKNKEQVDKVINSLMHKKVIAATRRSSIAKPRPLLNDESLTDTATSTSPRRVADLAVPSLFCTTTPPLPKGIFDRRKSDIYAPITPRRRGSVTTNYDLSITNRLLSEACNICLGDYEEGEDICWSRNKECIHAFHKRCISKWLETHEVCPCCRNDYVEHESDE